MEFLVPSAQEVFGIEIDILDRQGRNAFSFLLNSHHELFMAARLLAADSSENARGRMIEDATRAGTEEGNGVLQLDLDVTSWGGVVNRFANESNDRWIAYDWRFLDGFSFWLSGTNRGAEMFLDLFDDRHVCSRTDDAERFRYWFRDDVPGWRLIKARCGGLVRWEVGNNGPDDGLGLDAVHGRGVGALHTGGAVRLFIDDFRLLDDAADAVPASSHAD